MASVRKDITLVIGGSGTASSPVQFCTGVYNFAIKCDPAAVYKWEMADADGFGIAGSDNPNGDPDVGPISKPVNRNTETFVFTLYGATPGTYLIRVNII